GGETIREITKTLRAVQPTKLKGLIVDLRFNGGGYLDGAVDLASMFLNKGTVVTVEGRDRPPQSHAVSGNPILPVIKLSANPRTCRTMSEHIDLDVSGLLQRQKNLDQTGDELLEVMLRTCNGRLTAAEALGHREFVLTRLYESA
ncbi:MAG: UxaA family hydrolase, partial [Betaproteobacteria bacterium]|nr:UxaA family hydrolase [Betaproteobacteria bacterium]